jgi:hypothetical protein
MEIPSMKTWVDGEVVSPQDLNEQIRDVGDFVLGGRPAGRVARRASTQTLATDAWTAVAWDTVDYDTDSLFDPGNPSYVQVQTTGLYLLTATMAIAGSSAGSIRGVRIRSNTQGTLTDSRTYPSSTNMTGGASTQSLLAAGEVLYVEGYQNSGVDLVFAAYPGVTTAEYCSLALTWLGG